MLIYKKFYGTCAFIFDRFGSLDSSFAHSLAEFVGHKRRRRFFGKFLVSSLDRAVAFGEVASFAELVSYDLDFDMSRFLNEFFHIHTIITESSGGLLSSALEGFFEVFFFPYSTHTLSSSTSGGFEHDRIAHFLGDFLGFGNILKQAIGARNGRYPCGFHSSFGGCLITHFVNHFG